MAIWSGYFHGDVVFGSQNPGDTMADKQKLSPYPSKDKEPAKSLVLTEFRYLLLYPTRFVAMSRIVDGAISYDCNFSDKSDFKGPMLDFAHDPALGIIFPYSGAAVWEIIIKDERLH